MATLFEAYVTNAGKYSEGQLVGETLKFPTTAQEVEALLKRIGVDGVHYQEIFITSITINLDRKAGQPVRLSFHLMPKLQ